jgi:hypothetical protein
MCQNKDGYPDTTSRAADVLGYMAQQREARS